MLDVGCGVGSFAIQLAGRAEKVDALDRSAEMIDQACHRAPDNVECVLADILTDPLPADGYDAIFSISALHHMSLPDVLPKLAAALRPGGVLAAIALPRPDLAHELHVEIAAAVGYRALGTLFAARRALRRVGGFPKSDDQSMPVEMYPPLTTREAAAQVAMLLPGARVRRLLYWRYLLLWHKPGNPADLSSR
ncbi:class I SAM-dependent methyltransferase [Gryllotalpicola protaetiae]|uniref:class I SAM-dependent methyltransferase n=1 Tax=Gryllotalpicola protaetiae TaxID=2419771 RepID=UPI001C66014A|nr:class I SAM-dependent methyltransferase [Gryllotalpicola protaetiae]